MKEQYKALIEAQDALIDHLVKWEETTAVYLFSHGMPVPETVAKKGGELLAEIKRLKGEINI